MSWRQLGMLFALSAIWGSSFLFIKISVHEIAPMTLVAARLLLAFLVLLGVMRAQGLRLPRDAGTWWAFALLGVLGLIIPFWLITWGEQYISSSLAAILLATTPLLNVLLTVFVMRAERLALVRVLGLLLGFAGVIVAMGEGLELGASLLGRLAVVGAALCYAVSALYARARFRGMNPLTLSTGQMLTGSLLAIPAALVLDPLPMAVPSLLALGSLLALAVVGTAFAYILFYALLDGVGAARSSLVTYLVPGFALVYGVLLLGEPFSGRIALGFALIIGGILIASGKLSRESWRAAGRRTAV
jgi:drug/metabolite transporter (DMT)-like permease